MQSLQIIAEFGYLPDIFDDFERVVLQPKRLQPRVILQILDLRQSFVVEVKDVVQVRSHVEIILPAVLF